MLHYALVPLYPLGLSAVREPIGYLNQLMAENEGPVNHPGRTSRRLLVPMQGRSTFSFAIVLGVIRVQPVRGNIEEERASLSRVALSTYARGWFARSLPTL